MQFAINNEGANDKADIKNMAARSLFNVIKPMRFVNSLRAKSELDKQPTPNEIAIPTVIKRIGIMK